MTKTAIEIDLEENSPWNLIDTFDNRMFSIMTNGTPDGTEVFKYKGQIPAWATYWKPLEFLPVPIVSPETSQRFMLTFKAALEKGNIVTCEDGDQPEKSVGWFVSTETKEHLEDILKDSIVVAEG